MAFYKGKNKKTDKDQGELFAGDEIYGIKEEVQQFIDLWNSKIWLPKIIETPRQVALIRRAFDRPFFRLHWQETIPLLARSTWLRTKMRPAFCLDFYLETDNFDKILEGKYLTEAAPTEDMGNHTAARDGDDEYIR